MEYTIGTRIPYMNGWEIVKELGEGSYGKVFEVHKNHYGVTAKAALKLIRIPKSAADICEVMSEGMDEKSVTTYFEDVVKQFVKEITVMSQLKSHPNIVACEDYVVEPYEGKIGWDILIRMELLTPFTEYQLKNGLSEKDVIRLAKDICEALIYCQKKDLIHRDIKPGNIFVDENGRFKLGDFGVARHMEKTMGAYSKQGTESYMAPEVYVGKSYDGTVDIYSLGLVLYRLMNDNRLPFYAPAPKPIFLADREMALTARLRGDRMSPPCNASDAFATIILKACAYLPADRYQTAAEMLEDLKGLNPMESTGFGTQNSVLSGPDTDEIVSDEETCGTIGVGFKSIKTTVKTQDATKKKDTTEKKDTTKKKDTTEKKDTTKKNTTEKKDTAKKKEISVKKTSESKKEQKKMKIMWTIFALIGVFAFFGALFTEGATLAIVYVVSLVVVLITLFIFKPWNAYGGKAL